MFHNYMVPAMATDLTDIEQMLARQEQKSARLEVRSTQTQKSIIEKAAALLGESLSSYLLSTAMRDALQIIRDHQVTELSLDDWNRFANILETDALPNSELVSAKRLHRKHTVAPNAT
jgi:uncharacterized protein (DUF1778 family)